MQTALANGIVFKINKTFSEWAKGFHENKANQTAGIKSIFNTLSKAYSST